MLLSKMPLYHIWRGSESLERVHVNVTKQMVKQLSACQYVVDVNGLEYPYSTIMLAVELNPTAISYSDWDCPFVLGELSAGLVKELHKLKTKLRELGFSDRGFDSPTALEPAVPKNDMLRHTPFTLFECTYNRCRYLSVSEKTAAALLNAQHPDFFYNYPPRNIKNPCVRLSASLRLLSWNMDAVGGDVKEVQLGDLTTQEHAAYCDLLSRLVVLDEKKPAVAKEQSFTEALYQDRKAAAVKAAQPVIAKDLEVNTVSNFLTKGDDKMFRDRYLRSCSILTYCRGMRENFDWLFKHGGLDLEDEAAFRELNKAITKFYKCGVKTK